jgi:hypothetical protein
VTASAREPLLDGRLTVSALDPPLIALLDLSAAELTECGTTEPSTGAFAAAAPTCWPPVSRRCCATSSTRTPTWWPGSAGGAARAAARRPARASAGLDRFGVVLRLEFPSTDRDARLPFAQPLRTVEEAPSRMLRCSRGPACAGATPRR